MSGALAVWSLEWTQALRRRRVVVLSAAVPLLLVLAVALGGAPPPHAALVYSVLFVFFGTFGAAIPWARDAERGFLHRLTLAGVNLPSLALPRVVAGALVDLVELLPALLVIVAVYGVLGAAAVRLVIFVGLALVFANAVGVLVALLARSLAETALLASVTALLLLHAAGVFRTPVPGSLAEALQSAVPFHAMHQAIQVAVKAW